MNTTEKLRAAIKDIEGAHNDAGSLAHAVEHHWPTIKAALALLDAVPPEVIAAIKEGTRLVLARDSITEFSDKLRLLTNISRTTGMAVSWDVLQQASNELDALLPAAPAKLER